MAFERGVNAARNIREASLAAVGLELSRVPQDLPLNVQNMAHLVLTQDEMALTSMDVVQIVDQIRTSQVSCETVTRAFLRRAALAQHLVNCITELLPEHAIERARYLDSLSEPLGPLHGVPVSVKEQVGFDGKTNNFGYVAWGDRLQGPPCSLNRRLEAAGAIIFARTTQPQTVLHLETNSNLYGRTLNPWNRNLTSGGSSGGEAALLALKGSPLGVGGDIGGSIRNPAANCGVYGFKPTPFRIGNTGGMSHIAGQDGIIGCLGPMSTSLAGLELFMQAYLAQWPWVEESSLVPLPWRYPKLPARLKIGAMWSDGVVKPHPPVTRAMQMVVDALTTAGVMIVDWKPEKHEECWEITNALYFEDGGNRARNLLEQGDEPALPLTRWLLEENNIKRRDVESVWELKSRRNTYRAMYNDLWLSTGKEDGHMVDAILCPAGPGSAPPHDQSKYWSYTSQWNMLEYPAAVFPVTRVDPNVDTKDDDYVPINEKDRFNHHLYPGPGLYADAPVCLQIVTRRFEDEKCLAVVKRVEEILTLAKSVQKSKL